MIFQLLFFFQIDRLPIGRILKIYYYSLKKFLFYSKNLKKELK